jgi:hypothetical protein
MTELELEILKGQLIDRLVAVTDASGTHMSIFLTIISAYLVVAYIVVTKLTKLQVPIATSINAVAYAVEAWILFSYNRAIGRTAKQLLAINPNLALGSLENSPVNLTR